ncbi:hypothetical protein C1I98_04810, partial [Spongiactinospora gelatinilytica]
MRRLLPVVALRGPLRRGLLGGPVARPGVALLWVRRGVLLLPAVRRGDRALAVPLLTRLTLLTRLPLLTRPAVLAGLLVAGGRVVPDVFL